ncbi:hypothetical protein HDU76_007482 [Blyttiomyces sp. JEL0837]|nr:hypothetical protein HDU76_007482 [Blyttiomyces sp. JEL0837]
MSSSEAPSSPPAQDATDASTITTTTPAITPTNNDNQPLASSSSSSSSVSPASTSTLTAVTPSNTSKSSSAVKAKAAMLFGGVRFAKPSNFYVMDLTNETKTILPGSFAPSTSIYLKNLDNCTITTLAPCTKIFVEACKNCTVKVQGAVITSTLETWRSDDVVFEVKFARKADFGNLVWAQSEGIVISFDDYTLEGPSTINNTFPIGITESFPSYPDLIPSLDQFFVRFINNKLLCERVIRVGGGYASTIREDDEHIRKQDIFDRKMSEVISDSLKKSGIVANAAGSGRNVGIGSSSGTGGIGIGRSTSGGAGSGTGTRQMGEVRRPGVGSPVRGSTATLTELKDGEGGGNGDVEEKK